MFIVCQNAEEEEVLINYFVTAELPSTDTLCLTLLYLSFPFLIKTEMPHHISISVFN